MGFLERHRPAAVSNSARSPPRPTNGVATSLPRTQPARERFGPHRCAELDRVQDLHHSPGAPAASASGHSAQLQADRCSASFALSAASVVPRQGIVESPCHGQVVTLLRPSDARGPGLGPGSRALAAALGCGRHSQPTTEGASARGHRRQYTMPDERARALNPSGPIKYRESRPSQGNVFRSKERLLS